MPNTTGAKEDKRTEVGGCREGIDKSVTSFGLETQETQVPESQEYPFNPTYGTDTDICSWGNKYVPDAPDSKRRTSIARKGSSRNRMITGLSTVYVFHWENKLWSLLDMYIHTLQPFVRASPLDVSSERKSPSVILTVEFSRGRQRYAAGLSAESRQKAPALEILDVCSISSGNLVRGNSFKECAPVGCNTRKGMIVRKTGSSPPPCSRANFGREEEKSLRALCRLCGAICPLSG
ncbi:hypothetical protein KM043_012060 [Ampulex compressa]|nr:hypothetical protein KM043_012060 [Ampulex compressa]